MTGDMVEFAKNKWKYSTISLLAVLAIGFSFPQASAHVTNNVMHMLTHVFDNTEEIKDSTDNLPSDPASQSLTGITKAMKGRIDFNPADGQISSFSILGVEGSKVFSGRIFLNGVDVADDGLNNIEVDCILSLAQTQTSDSVPIALTEDFRRIGSSALVATTEFTCSGLRVSVEDPAGSGDQGILALKYVVEYVETENVEVNPEPTA